MTVHYTHLADGTLAAWISENADRFVEARRWIEQRGGQVQTELLGLDQSYVDYDIDGQRITLHSEAFGGIAVLTTTPDTEATVRQIARAICLDWQRSEKD